MSTSKFPWLVVFGLAAVVWSTPLHAQQIRKYGDETGGSGDGGASGGDGEATRVYPGQPMPQGDDGSEGQSSEQNQNKQQSEEGEDAGSYEIRFRNAEEGGKGGEGNEEIDKSVTELYRGIIPGKRNEVEHLKESSQDETGPNKLTWLGFRPEEKKTRVFVQVSQSADHEVSRADEGRKFRIKLPDTKIADRNFSRSINTSFFERNVQQVEAVQREGDVEISISLKNPEGAQVENEGKYLYIDFEHASGDSEGSDESNEDETGN